MRLRAVAVERRTLSDGVLARNIVETSSEAFIGLGTDGAVEDWSSSAEKLFGVPRGEVVGLNLSTLVRRGRFSPPGSGGLAEVLMHPPADDRTVVQSLAISRSGAVVPVEVSVARGSGPSGWSTRAFVRDLSRWTLPDTLPQQDPLTKLPIAAALGGLIAEALERERPRGRLVAVCHVDIDRMGFVNDALGHDAGDELLVALAERLAIASRRPKSVARYGGDEFVAVVDQVKNVEDAVTLAARLVRVMANPVLLAGREIFPSASVGVALADPSSEDEPAILLAQASFATQRAKQRGGGSWELFDRSMGQNALRQLELEADLRLAVERDELRLHYQPIVTTAGEPWGYEALVRWQHPERGLVGPAEFLVIAEATGLIGSIGDWVLQQGARQIVAWREQVPHLRLAVNLSPRQLAEPELASRVSTILGDEALPAEALSFEVTEGGLVGWAGGAASSLAGLVGIGASITLDDFGVGYTSLLYLRRFPIDRIKLDRYFLSSVGRDPGAVASVVGLAHSLGLDVVTVGVETVADLRLVEGAGSDLVQGHLIAPPRPAEQVAAQLAKRPLFSLEEQPSPQGGGSSAAGSRGAPAEAAGGSGTADQPAPGMRRVLVVAGAGEARDALWAALRALPALDLVDLAESVETALEAAGSYQPDVAVVDLALSGDDGLHLLPELVRRAPRARLVVRSGFVTPAVERALQARGADVCLDARSSPERVAEVVAELAPLDAPRPPLSLPEVSLGHHWSGGLLTAPLRRSEVREPARVLEEFVDHVLTGRKNEAVQQVIELRRAGGEFEQIVEDVLAAALTDVAVRLQAGRISVVEAEIAGALTSSALDALAAVGTPAPALGSVAYVYPSGDPELLPGRLMAECLQQRGWQVAPLGPTPPGELEEFLRRRRIGAVLLSCSTPVLLDAVVTCIDAAHGAGVRLLASGAAFGATAVRAEHLGADGWADGARSATRILSDWRRQRFEARSARSRVLFVGARSFEIGSRAGQLARRASLTADDAVAELVATGVRGAVASLLVDDGTMLEEVAAGLRTAVGRSQLSTRRLLDALAGARDVLAEADEHGLAVAQLDLLCKLVGSA